MNTSVLLFGQTNASVPVGQLPLCSLSVPLRSSSRQYSYKLPEGITETKEFLNNFPLKDNLKATFSLMFGHRSKCLHEESDICF